MPILGDVEAARTGELDFSGRCIAKCLRRPARLIERPIDADSSQIGLMLICPTLRLGKHVARLCMPQCTEHHGRILSRRWFPIASGPVLQSIGRKRWRLRPGGKRSAAPRSLTEGILPSSADTRSTIERGL